MGILGERLHAEDNIAHESGSVNMAI